jgi:hypothetical protein
MWLGIAKFHFEVVALSCCLSVYVVRRIAHAFYASGDIDVTSGGPGGEVGTVRADLTTSSPDVLIGSHFYGIPQTVSFLYDSALNRFKRDNNGVAFEAWVFLSMLIGTRLMTKV